MGAQPQDLKYAGEDSALVIGDENLIREFTTLHIGTAGGGGVTRIGNRNLFMAYSHVAHDCQVGNGCVFANGADARRVTSRWGTTSSWAASRRCTSSPASASTPSSPAGRWW